MYVNYLEDRKKLGFSCIKDTLAAKQISSLKDFVKRTTKILVTYIVKKGKQLFILIFSKEVLVAVFIFSRNVDPVLYRPFSEVYHCCISESNNLEFKKILKSFERPSPILDSILKMKGGHNDWTETEMENLIKSVLSKTPKSSSTEISFNKLFNKILKLIEPIILDETFWKIVAQAQKPLPSQVTGFSNLRSSTDIFGPVQNAPDNQAKTRLKGSSIFADALSNQQNNLSNSQTRRKFSSLTTTEKKNFLTMAQTSNEESFSTGLTPSGLSLNHEKFSEKIQSTEKATQSRRAEPLYSSEVLGPSFQYSQKQLEIKAFRHLEPDFGVSVEGKTLQQMAVEYHDCIENLLKQPDLIVRKDGRLSKREPAINIGDPESRRIVSFENNPLYDKNRLISAYEISPEAFQNFKLTGNIGLSPEERKFQRDELQKIQAKTEREIENATLLYSNLPNDARISNKQLKQFEMLKEQLKTDSDFQLTNTDKKIIERAEKYLEYKQEFSKNNPKIFDDEL